MFFPMAESGRLVMESELFREEGSDEVKCKITEIPSGVLNSPFYGRLHGARKWKNYGRSCPILMKKQSHIIVLFAFALLALSLFVSLAFAAVLQPVNFGQDGNKMQWYLVNYGKNNDGPFACTRKYYTNPDEKQKTIDLIVEKFGVEQAAASGLYFTEYGYVYSQDGKKFAVSYITHYDMLGKVIKSTEYDAAGREYVKMSKEMIPFKAYPYAIGKLPAQKAVPKKK